MGTLSLTHVKDESGQTIMTMYRQMDGYPSGHGADLLAFLKGMVVVNGIGSTTPEVAANGMGCLAAQLVAHFKEDHGIGGIYLYPPDSSNCGEEYTYTISLGAKVKAKKGGHSPGNHVKVTVREVGYNEIEKGPEQSLPELIAAKVLAGEV